MYEKFKGKKEILLWCSAESEEEPSNSAQIRERSEREKVTDLSDDADTIYQSLKKKHCEAYSVPQLRLWARMIHCLTHDSCDTPPRVPVFRA